MRRPSGAESIDLHHPVFISDLHLTEDRPHTVQRFLRLTQDLAGGGRELVILGDLFEYWAGDEEAADGIGATVSRALRRLADSGTAVYLMHGNRDILLGPAFARACCATLLADPCRTVLGTAPTLLSHGDAWCTLDRDYQAFRRRARNPIAQHIFLGLPLALRRAVIRRMRAISESGKKSMAMQIMDVTDAAIEEAFRSSQALRIIHGHTHRPAVHRLQVDGRDVERRVLPDWDCDETAASRGGYLQWADNALVSVDLARVPA